MERSFNWFKDNTSIKIHPSVSVSRSSVSDENGGTGVFVTRSKLQDVKADTAELLRIPPDNTFSIHTLLNIVHDVSSYSSEESFNNTTSVIKDAFTQFMTNSSFQEWVSETNILVFYFVLFRCLKEKFELPKRVIYYLEHVLLTTKVNSPVNVIGTTEHFEFMEFYGQYGAQYLEKLLEKLGNFFAGHFEICPSAIEIRQIYSSIVSRCLEIPQEVSRNSEDFLVNSTLVPVLDFVNHDNSARNTHFDIDRKTSEVLLVLELDKCPQAEELFEVFISYSPVEELTHFETVYGFIPEPSDTSISFWNLSFDRKYLENHGTREVNMRLFYKWFGINPCIQLIINNDTVLINDSLVEFGEILLPFVPHPLNPHTPCFAFNPSSYKTFASFASAVNKKTQENYLEQFYKTVRSQELSERDVMSLPQLAWSCYLPNEEDTTLDKVHRVRLDKEQCVSAIFDKDNNYDAARDLFVDYMVKYCNWRLGELSKAGTRHNLSAFEELKRWEIKILESLIKQFKSGETFFWSDFNKGGSKDLPKCPLAPPVAVSYNSSAASYEIPARPQVNDKYDELQFTDFPQEELEQYYEFFLEN